MTSASSSSSSASSRQSPLFDCPPPSFDTFSKWATDRGITWNPSLNVGYDEEMGWRVVATDDIKLGSILCAVPKSKVLSHRTSHFSEYLPIDIQEASSTDLILQLSACLLYEVRQGRDSEYWGYTQLLPRETVLLPSFWEDEELAGEEGRESSRSLDGTDLGRELNRKNEEGLSMDDFRTFHSAIKEIYPLTPSHPEPPSLYSFIYAYSMISTRAFIIDAYHGIALIPYCDLFNHSNFAHSSLLSDMGVCPTCGSLPRCCHDLDDSQRIEHLSKEYLDEVKKEGSNVDMRVERKISKGEQVFSCYEEDLSDSKSLVEWGFISS